MAFDSRILESSAALDYRREILHNVPVRHDAHYGARTDYFNRLTWLQVPLERAADDYIHVSVLHDTNRQQPYKSSVIGVISTEEFFMNPHGDCLDPSNIAGAALRFSLEPPDPARMPHFHHDYHAALHKFRVLQCTLGVSMLSPVPHRFVSDIYDRLSFHHPLFLGADQHPLLSALSPLPVASNFGPGLFGLSTPWRVAPNPHPHHSPGVVNRRERYPVDPIYHDAFLQVDPKLTLQEPIIYAPTTSIRIQHVSEELPGALAVVEFILGGGEDGVLHAVFTNVRLLTTLEPVYS